MSLLGLVLASGLSLAGAGTHVPSVATLQKHYASPRVCFNYLAELGVGFQNSDIDDKPFLVKLHGDLAGYDWHYDGKDSVHSHMDCRLVLALYRFSALHLRPFTADQAVHLSSYRPNARVKSTKKRSGHADALAVDLRFLKIGDEIAFDVLSDWQPRKRGQKPCEVDDKDERSAAFRKAVCAAVEENLFQVVVTPHHDKAHANHVHLEVVPGADWTWIR